MQYIIMLILIIFLVYILVIASTYAIMAISIVGAVVGGFIALKNYALSFKRNMGSLRRAEREENAA